MSLRIFTEPQQGASYDQLLAVARSAEECGFDAFFRSDHVLAMGGASGMPAYTDAWTTLAGLARDTHSIRLGTLVTPVTFRAVGTLPVIVSGVDHMSHGRVEVGLGAGWYKDEHRAYGLAFPDAKSRFDLLEDQLHILKGAWSTPEGSTFDFAGNTCSVHLRAGPLQPFQKPHPPIILGGRGGPRNAQLAAMFADEFNAAFVPMEKVKAAYGSVRASCEALGRDPDQLVWSVAQVLCCGSSQDEVARRADAIGTSPGQLRQDGLAGTPAEVLDKLNLFLEGGVERFYLQVLDLSDLDHLRLVATEVLPQYSKMTSAN